MADRGWKQPFHSFRRFLARGWRRFNQGVTVIGVAGSYGKTNTSRAISMVLSEKYPVLQTDLNLDSVYNIPLTILKLRPRHKFLVLEMGIDHKGEMNSHLDLARPKIGVLTGITPVHSEKGLLNSLEGIMEEKGRLLEVLPEDGWAILNWDDENVQKMSSRTRARIIRYGTRRSCDFWAERISVDFSGTSLVLRGSYPGLTLSEGGLRVKMPLVGKHFAHAALVAAIIGLIHGLTTKQVIAGLSKLEPLRGRMSVEEGPLGTVLLNDALRANPASTMAGLETLADLPAKKKKVAVLGEMGELGNYAEVSHRLIGEKVAGAKVDLLVSIGPLQKFTVEEAIKSGMKRDKVFWVKDVFEAADVLKEKLEPGDLLYLKGSLLRHLERVVLILRNKRVDCGLIVCHQYNQCSLCPQLRKTN